MDPKRPYGNSNVFGDIAAIIGIKSLDEDGYDFKEEDVLYMKKIHAELATVVQIGICTSKFEAGEYINTAGEYSRPEWMRMV